MTQFTLTNTQTGEIVAGQEVTKSYLPPLSEVDTDEFDEPETSVTLTFPKCTHILELVSSTHARCTRCGAGWTGPDVHKLVDQSPA